MKPTKYNPILSISKRFPKNKKLIIGLSGFLSFIFIGFVGSLFIPYNPVPAGTFGVNQPPSSSHPLGTDALGRDVLFLLMYSVRESLKIGLLAGIVGSLIGILVGFIGGFKGGYMDDFLSSVTNVLLVIPTFPLLVAISCYVREVTVFLVAILLAAFSWPWPSRTIRAQVMSLKERDFINLAKISGLSDFEVMFREVLPNMLPFLGVNFANSISGAMLAEVGLEVIGLGPRGISTLGLMLYWAQNYASLSVGAWWAVFPQIIFLILMFIFLHLINLGLDEWYNPRLRK